MKSKKKIGIFALCICLCLALCLGVCLLIGKNAGNTWQEQYDLGIRYIESGDYAQAVLAFTAAIEIDPSRPEAYLQISDALLAQDDIAGALEYARLGAERTGNEELKQKAEELEQRATVELCEHEWIPATLVWPETCSKCGTTQGETVDTFFSENGLDYIGNLPEEPIPFKFVTYNINDPTDFFVSDQGRLSIEQSIQETEDSGYKQLTVVVTSRMPIEYRVDEDDLPYAMAQMNVQSEQELYDAYTGYVIAGQETFRENDENGVIGAIRGYEASVDIGGEPIPIQYTVKSSWESEGWTVNEESGYNILLGKSVITYTFILPMGYDGLLYALEPTFDYPANIFSEPSAKTGASVLDLREDILAETMFILLGQNEIAAGGKA